MIAYKCFYVISPFFLTERKMRLENFSTDPVVKFSILNWNGNKYLILCLYSTVEILTLAEYCKQIVNCYYGIIHNLPKYTSIIVLASGAVNPQSFPPCGNLTTGSIAATWVHSVNTVIVIIRNVVIFNGSDAIY